MGVAAPAPAGPGCGAGAVGRGLRGTAGLIARVGAGAADRSGENLDRGADRGVRDRHIAGAGAKRLSAHTGPVGDWLVMAADLTCCARACCFRPTRPRVVCWSAAPRSPLPRTGWNGGRSSSAVCSRGGCRTRRIQPGAGGRATSPGCYGPDITGLLRAYLLALALPGEVGAAYRVPIKPFWTTADAVARIRASLPALDGTGRGLEVFLPGVPPSAPDRDRRCRAALASTFLGGLELAREGVLGLEQDRLWETVRVVRCEAAEQRGASSMM